VESSRGIQMTTLSRLAARAAGNTSALCARDFVAQQWRAERVIYRC